MKCPRGCLLTVLVYVVLDLSMPMMPGAFVFEPADSVDSVQVNRGRDTLVAVLPAPVPERAVVSRPRVELGHRPAARGDASPTGRTMARRLPRAALGPDAPSEEAH